MTPAMQAIDPSRGQAKFPPNPWRLIGMLGLDSACEIFAFTDRAQAFQSIQMGLKDVKIGQLLDLITSDSGGLCPPTTGSLSDWGIAAPGRAGGADFNRAICANGYGYRLLDCFKAGDSPAPELAQWLANGDDPPASHPVSPIGHNSRTAMQFYAWNGTGFAAIAPSAPRFAPFLLADLDGGLRSLVDLHGHPIDGPGGASFGLLTLQGVIAANQAAVRPMLIVLIEQAARSSDPRRSLSDLISHCVALDGTIARHAPQPDGKGFKLADQHYASARALVDHALIPLQAVAQPHQFFAGITDLPALLPVLSDPLMEVLSAVLSTHYPEMPAGCASVAEPFNAHLIWRDDDTAEAAPPCIGARPDAAKLSAKKRIATVLVSQFGDINPISSITLPARIFKLWPTTSHASDTEALSELFRLVRPLSHGPDDNGQRTMQKAINSVVRGWIKTHTGALSPYFLDRFAEACGGYIPGEGRAANEPILPQAGALVEPEGFRDLTLRQASMIVSALQAISKHEQDDDGRQLPSLLMASIGSMSAPGPAPSRSWRDVLPNALRRWQGANSSAPKE